MKANEAPEKIYLEKVYPDNGVLPNGLNYNQSSNDIEYIRTDAFIEKACKWLEKYVTYIHPRKGKEECIVNLTRFRDYMKGE